MSKLNLATVYNDFGDTLPQHRDVFFNAPSQEVTREMLKDHYGVRSGARAYDAFVKDYGDYVANLKPTKQEVKDEAK